MLLERRRVEAQSKSASEPTGSDDRAAPGEEPDDEQAEARASSAEEEPQAQAGDAEAEQPDSEGSAERPEQPEAERSAGQEQQPQVEGSAEQEEAREHEARSVEERPREQEPRSEQGTAEREAESEGSEDEAHAEEHPAAQGASERDVRAVVDRARNELQNLLGTEPERVSGFERSDSHWSVTLDVVDLRRVPESTDVLASYEVLLDDDRNVVSVTQKRRYRRSQVEED